jgi:hypothetical protein
MPQTVLPFVMKEKEGRGLFFYGTKGIDVKQKTRSCIKDLEQTKDAMVRVVKIKYQRK